MIQGIASCHAVRKRRQYRRRSTSRPVSDSKPSRLRYLPISSTGTLRVCERCARHLGRSRAQHVPALSFAEECRAGRNSLGQTRDVHVRSSLWRELAMHDSAIATAKPPSLQSCAERPSPQRLLREAHRSRALQIQIAHAAAPADNAVNRRQILSAAKLVRVSPMRRMISPASER